MPAVPRTARSKRRKPATIWDRPAVTPEELYAAGLLPVGRDAIYAACNTGEFKTIRRGRKILILTAPLRKKLGMQPT
jgi:hypothetical protein